MTGDIFKSRQSRFNIEGRNMGFEDRHSKPLSYKANEELQESLKRSNNLLIEEFNQLSRFGVDTDLLGFRDDESDFPKLLATLNNSTNLYQSKNEPTSSFSNRRLTRRNDKRLLRRLPWRKAEKDEIFEILGEAIIPDKPDIKYLRQREGLSQADFARVYALNLSSLRAWERGIRPSPITCAYLRLIELWPNLVREMLGLNG